MSTIINTTQGQRIRQERVRLELSQAEIGKRLGVSRATQVNYETDKRSPDAKYLIAMGRLGVDIGFVLFGERSTPNTLYSMGAARVLPIVCRRAGLDVQALTGILDLAAEDEALGWAGGEIKPDVQAKIMKLIDAFFENGDLLGKVFLGVSKALHDAQAKLLPAKKSDIVLLLYDAFKGRGRVEKKTLEITVKAATQ